MQYVSLSNQGARCSSVVRVLSLGVGLILHGEHIELFLVPASASRLV